MHPLTYLAARQRQHGMGALAPQQSLGHLGATTDDIAQAVVDTVVPAVQNRMPVVAQAFVDEAVPRVQQRLSDLQPQLNELAVNAARNIVNDEQVQQSVKAATDRAVSQMKTGFALTGALILACTSVVLVSQRH